MTSWQRVPPVAVGGLVAVAFWDEDTVAVGSHSGIGLVDARTGAVRGRESDPHGDYAWYQADPPSIRKETPTGVVLMPSMGLWGGNFRKETDDGWSAALVPTGALVSHEDRPRFAIEDTDEPRALGFSQGGTLLIFATSSTLHLCHRSSV
ncbi:hypothetical protein GCM10022242_29070 [Nocardioides panacisoli]|uniref:Uncharacterized protein n=1 Tax=Nocardioides panacisoli TaxID=627624 RepID=A0ABP7ITH7_9ACTN